MCLGASQRDVNRQLGGWGALIVCVLTIRALQFRACITYYLRPPGGQMNRQVDGWLDW